MTSFGSNDLALEDPTYTTDVMNQEARSIIMGEDAPEAPADPDAGREAPRPAAARSESAETRRQEAPRLPESGRLTPPMYAAGLHESGRLTPPMYAAGLHPPMYAAVLRPVQPRNGEDQTPAAVKKPAPSLAAKPAETRPAPASTKPAPKRWSSVAPRKSLSALADIEEGTIDFERANGLFDERMAALEDDELDPEKSGTIDFERANGLFDERMAALESEAKLDARTCSFGWRCSSAGSPGVEFGARAPKAAWDARTYSFGMPAGGLEVYEDSE